MIVKVKYRLSKTTIDRILRLREVVKPEPAETLVSHSSSESESDARIRRTEVRWLMQREHPFVHDELVKVVQEHQFRFGITGPLYV